MAKDALSLMNAVANMVGSGNKEKKKKAVMAKKGEMPSEPNPESAPNADNEPGEGAMLNASNKKAKPFPAKPKF